MNFKKFISAVLVLALALALFTGCGAAAETEVSKSIPQSEPGGEPAEGQTPPDMPEGQNPGGQGGPGGEPGGQAPGSSASVEYTSVMSFDSDTSLSAQEITSTGADENALLVTDGTVTLSNLSVSRKSSSSTGGDNSSFYGVGAAVLATGGTVEISDSEIETDSAGGAGIFAYGSGTVYATDCSISTEQNTSGGIHVAGGGTLYADNVTAVTQGESSAAVRSDRGGGLMVITSGSYTSNGIGSPAVYCTATIAAKEAELSATGSEAVCIEGMNSLYLYNCTLSGAMQENEQNDCCWNVILYQSMSGDSQLGNSTFQMSGGTLTAENGGMFYTTNTQSTFILDSVEIIPSSGNEFFLKVTGNSNARGWGETGSNGADCSFTAISQSMEGDVIWDSISSLDFYMTSGSTLTGAFLQDESNAGNGGSGYANLIISADSSWIVTEDSCLSSLSCAGTMFDSEGKSVTVKGTDGSVYVTGSGSITVTVDSFSTEADLSEAGSLVAFEDAQVNNGYQTEDMGEMGGMPEGQDPFGQGGNGQTPPDMPEGQNPGGPGGEPGGQGGNGQTPPEKPSK